MIGAIIGDIVGSTYEFNNTSDYNFPLFATGSSFTDDTICTLAIADAIISGKPYKDRLLEWCRAYPYPMGGYGGRFAQWIASGGNEPYGSFGNGSAMRVSPVAWAYDDLRDVLKEATKTAMPTHSHPEGVKGAMAVAHAIWYFRSNMKMDGFIDAMQEYYPNFQHEHYKVGVFDETCQGTVPLCLNIVCHARGFEDAIRIAVSHGGDSDTIGAIVGAMAEARFGIPESIYDKAFGFLDERMLATIHDFFYMLNERENGKD